MTATSLPFLFRHPAATLRRLLAAALLAPWLAAPALAQQPHNITPGEIALLPPYCPDTQSFGYGDAYFNTSPRAAYWIRLMDAKSFWALHHYCWGLIKMRRAEAIGIHPVIRQGMIRNAIADYDYVLIHGSPDFVLRPEILLRRGEALLRINDVGGALESFEGAVRQRPDYWPAYVRWAEFLISVKKPKDAQAFLERGLVHAPDSPQLHAAYKKAGGDPVAFVKRLPPRPAAGPDAGASGPAAAASAPAASAQAASAPAASAPAASAPAAAGPAAAASGGR
jgi:tetratricopeptide (TPR) repeat protein